jgi:hypothetical protein
MDKSIYDNRMVTRVKLVKLTVFAIILNKI